MESLWIEISVLDKLKTCVNVKTQCAKGSIIIIKWDINIPVAKDMVKPRTEVQKVW